MPPRKLKSPQQRSITMSTQADPEDDNVTPMIDLYVVLLLIYVIMALVVFQGVKFSRSRENSAAGKIGNGSQVNVSTEDGLDDMALAAGSMERPNAHQGKVQPETSKEGTRFLARLPQF